MPVSIISALGKLKNYSYITSMKEIWKDIKGLEGYYMISNFGKIKRLEYSVPFINALKNVNYRTYREKISIPKAGKNGYVGKSISVNGIYLREYMHRLVANHFIANPNNYPFVMHLDNNPTNNRVDNLQWGNNSMNIKQAYSDGRKKCTITKEVSIKGGLKQGNINKANGHWDKVQQLRWNNG